MTLWSAPPYDQRCEPRSCSSSSSGSEPAGKVNRLGAPSPLTTMRLIREFRDEFFYLAGIPVWLQRLLAGARP